MDKIIEHAETQPYAVTLVFLSLFFNYFHSMHKNKNNPPPPPPKKKEPKKIQEHTLDDLRRSSIFWGSILPQGAWVASANLMYTRGPRLWFWAGPPHFSRRPCG